MPALTAAELPWAERHRPKHLGEVVGNTDQVRKLAEWLRDWDDVVLKGKIKEAKAPEAWMTFKPKVENINARAVLVSGPPGIGKTTTATLVAKCCRKYAVMEFNASDARSKKIIDNMSKSLAGNHTLSLGKKSAGTLTRQVIIMDECDGMAGGGDQGGMAALIAMIKATKNPIICICNDRNDPQVRNLADHCYDIKFKKPDTPTVAKRLKNMLEIEGKKVDLMALEATTEACGGDIRQVINHMQFFGSMAGADGGSERGTQKDTQVMLSPFDAVAQLLSKKKDSEGKLMSIERKMDMFYIEADLMPLMVQENYLKTLSDAKMATAAHAAELIATADTFSGSWECMSSAGIIGTIYPACLAAVDGPLMRANFPGWLQKRSTMTKGARLAQEMHSKMRATTSLSCRSMVTTGFHDLLHRRLLHPLAIGDTKTCAKQLVACGLTRDFFTDQAPALRTPLQLEDGYKKVEGKNKSQLLHDLQEMVQASVACTKRKRPKGLGSAADGSAGGGGDYGADYGAEEDAADAGPDDDGNMIKKQKTMKKSAMGAKKKKDADAPPSLESTSKASLKSWRPKAPDKMMMGEDGIMIVDERKKQSTIQLKFIEGHTNAVRRRVYTKELLAPWREF